MEVQTLIRKGKPFHFLISFSIILKRHLEPSFKDIFCFVGQ